MKAFTLGVASALLFVIQAGHAATVDTFAGGQSSNNLQSSQIGIYRPRVLAFDAAGNLYYTADGYPQVRKVDSLGHVTPVAGTGTYGDTGEGGPATSARIGSIRAMAFDSAGNLYLADLDASKIRKVSPSGIITTIAGNGLYETSGDGGPAASAGFGFFTTMAIDANDRIYIGDVARIRMIDATGTINTIAGDDDYANSGDGGPAVNAKFGRVQSLAFDGAGNLYVADGEFNRVRKINPAGIISAFAGNGFRGSGGDGGLALNAQLGAELTLTTDHSGNVFIGDNFTNKVRRVNAAGIITAFAGTGGQNFSGDGGPAVFGAFRGVLGLAADVTGNVFISDGDNYRIRKVDTNGIISTSVGNGSLGFSGDGGSATDAGIIAPWSTAVDAQGNVFIADSGNHRVRKVDTSGNITTVAGNGLMESSGDGGAATAAGLYTPLGVAVDSAGNLYISDQFAFNVRKVDTNGIITTVAGNGNQNYSGDGGLATSASLMSPQEIVVDGSGNLYIADVGSGRIRKVDSTGIITSIAGNGNYGYSGDGGPAVSATLGLPLAVEVAASGNVYIGEALGRIRKIDTTGIISTIAGNGGQESSGDGGPATSASIGSVLGISVAGDGTVYFSGSNNQVRKVSVDGIISRVAGTGEQGFSGDGGDARDATFSQPYGISLDPTGDVLYLADNGNHRVRRIVGLNAPADSTPPTIEPTVTGTQGNAGWYTSDIAIAWDVHDDESEVTSVDGCDSTTVVSDTTGATFTCTAVSGGGSASQSVTVKRDATPPEVIATPTGMPNDAGWYSHDVTVTFSATDSTSDVAECDPATAIVTEGFEQEAAGGCTDFAGNRAEGTATVNLDKTPPEIASVDSSPINGAGWYGEIVWFHPIGVDSLSGIPWDGCPYIEPSHDGADQSFTVTCHDSAGLSTSLTLQHINVDTTPPTVVGVLTPAANDKFWNNTDVTVSFAGADGLSGSGIATCSPNLTFTAETTKAHYAGSCTDVAGNSAEMFSTLRIDKTLPTIAITSPLNGASFVRGTSVPAAYACDDTQSFIFTCDGTLASGAAIDTATAGPHSFTVVATDRASNVRAVTVNYTVTAPVPVITPTLTGTLGANGWYTSNVALTWSIASDTTLTSQTGCQARSVTGNTTGVTYTCSATNAAGTATQSVTIKKDAAAPTSTLTGITNNASYASNAVVVPTYSCSDTVSGTVSCSGTVPSGSPVDTATVGAKNFLLVTQDAAGNSFTRSINYTVVAAPTVTPAVTGTLGTNGWYTSNVSLTWTVTPTGVSQTGCQSRSVNANNTGVSYTCTATNVAGSASDTVTIKRDATAPTSTITVPANNASYGVGQLVNASYSCADAFSGLASCDGTVGNGVPIDTGSAGTKSFTVVAKDAAGNTFTRTVGYTVVAAPTVVPSFTGTLGNNGWYVSNVALTWAVSSPTTSQSGCGARNVTANSAGTTYTCTATNAAGTNSQSVTIKRDAVGPTLSITRPANNATYARNASVIAAFACSDTPAGVASCIGPIANGAPINTSAPGTFTFTVNAVDAAGNASSLTRTYTVN